MTQYLPSAVIMFDENTSLEKTLATTDDCETGYIVEVDLKYSDKTTQNKIFSTLFRI